VVLMVLLVVLMMMLPGVLLRLPPLVVALRRGGRTRQDGAAIGRSRSWRRVGRVSVKVRLSDSSYHFLGNFGGFSCRGISSTYLGIGRMYTEGTWAWVWRVLATGRNSGRDA
jgi:hypothetical protein